MVLDGHPVLGRHGWAGEIGHVTVDPSGPACACGSTGCLEQYAGRRALVEAAGLAPTAGTAELIAAVESADPAAVAAVDRAAWGLGTALGAVVNLVDVPVIVLGGHLRELAGLLQPRVEAILRRLPGLRLAVPADAIRFKDDMQIYGVHALPVAWDVDGARR